MRRHIINTGFNVKQLFLLSNNCVFVWLSGQTAIISLYGIRSLVVRKGVYLQRGTNSILRPRGSRVRSRACPRETVVDKVRLRFFFSRFQFSLSVSCHQCSRAVIPNRGSGYPAVPRTLRRGTARRRN
jgi:hypothetical protein